MRTTNMDGSWFEKWLEEHEEMIRGYAGKGCVFYIDKEDILQELIITCFEASQNFNPDSGVTFSTYAVVAMRNKLNMLKGRNDRT